MAWLDADESVVVGDGNVYFASVDDNPTLPAKGSDPTDSLDPLFVGGGFITEDGVGQSFTPTIQDFMALQSLQPIRRERTAQEGQFTFGLIQWNETNVVLALGGAVEESGGIYTFTLPKAGDALAEWSLVIDLKDGDKNLRWVAPRGNVTEAVDSSFTRSEMAVLPITFKLLEPAGGGDPGYFVTDAPGFAAGS